MTRTAIATDRPDDHPWISTTEAAQLLGITTRGLYRLIDRGLVPAYRIDRAIRLRRAEVMHYLSTIDRH